MILRLKKDFSSLAVQLFFWTPFFKPHYFSTIATLDSFFDVWKVVVAIIVVARYIIRKKISKFILLVFLFVSMEWFTVIIHHQSDYWMMFLKTVPIVCVCILTEQSIQECFAEMLAVIEGVGAILLTINLGTILAYPNGMPIFNSYNTWFLGYKNQQILLILPITVAAILAMNLYGGWRIKEVVIVILAEANCILNKSMTSMIAITILVIVSLVYKQVKFTFNVWLLTAIYIVTNVSIIYFNIQEHMAWFFEGILNRTRTLTGRVILWNRTLQLIREHPIIGHGFLSKAERVARTGVLWSVHSHNEYLELLLVGGILLLSVFVFLLIVIMIQLTRHKISDEFKLLSVLCFVVFVLFLTEVYSSEFFVFFVFALSYNIGEIEEKSNMPSESKSRIQFVFRKGREERVI